MKFGIIFRMKFRNCTKSDKANAEIFSELAWNNFRIWQYFPNKGGSFPTLIRNSEFFSEVIRSIRTIPNFFPRSIRSIRTIPNFFPRSFGVFGQFRIFFRAHSEYSDNSELISELYAEIIWKFIKILCFFTKIFFFSFGKVRILRTLFSELIFGISFLLYP